MINIVSCDPSRVMTYSHCLRDLATLTVTEVCQEQVSQSQGTKNTVLSLVTSDIKSLAVQGLSLAQGWLGSESQKPDVVQSQLPSDPGIL